MQLDYSHIQAKRKEIAQNILKSYNNSPLQASSEEELEKAEGDRGGKVIGHTKSGKPIYFHKNASEYKGFSQQDHHDATDAHSAYAYKNKHNDATKKAGRQRANDHDSHAKTIAQASKDKWPTPDKKEDADAVKKIKAAYDKGDMKEALRLANSYDTVVRDYVPQKIYKEMYDKGQAK